MIVLKTYAGQNINPADDAILYDKIIGWSGKVDGCDISHLGANILKISSGRLIIKGRLVTVTDETIYTTMSTSGTLNGRLLIHMDLSNVEEPISFVTQAAPALPELVQNENCNLESGVYEIALATYVVDESMISNLTVVTPQFPMSEKELQDLARTGDSADNTVTFTGGDATDPTGWADVALLGSGEKHSSLWRKVSLAVKNTRWLKKVVDKLNTDLVATNTAVGKKQDASTAITTANIGQQSVDYATRAGSATDSTARANAAAALEKGNSTIIFSSTTIFTTYGGQYVIKVGKLAYLRMFFAINSALSKGNLIATVPPGFRPYVDFGQLALVNTYNGSKGTVTIEKNGSIRAGGTFSSGHYVLEFAYPID